MALEPWEHTVVCKGATHGYTERRVVRTWGRRKLDLLDPLLPYADYVDVYLKGRALPSFYSVRLPGVTFLLGLPGAAGNSWSRAGFDLATRRDGRDLPLAEPALAFLRQALQANVDETAAALGCDWETARRLLTRLCRRGCVLYDLEKRLYRHRELFAVPVDETQLQAPDPRRQRGLEYVTRR